MERYIGKMLDNRYEILEAIGTGGMAVVFKAKCHRLNRMVAIKMLKKDLSEDAEFRRRFHDESQAVAMLSHPNIVAVYDVSRGGDMDYIVMELIDGITLKQYMERRGRLNWPEALHFITQIMRGLSHAHSRGIVHRDIKPQNIMVLRDGTVKVTDFGIACLNGSNPSNEAIGSVHYISPEQAKGDYTDNRSDIYSAGVVLYEMLTSRLPFEGSDPVSVAVQHMSAVPLNPRELNPDIPEALEQICMKAMAPDRSRRYTTADEMLLDLEAFRKDPSVNFEYSMEELRPEQGSEDEPTQHIPNAAVAKTRQAHYRNPPAVVEEDEEEERPRGTWWKVLLLLLVIGVLGYFGVNKLYQDIMGSFAAPPEVPEYRVPSVVGMTVEEAEAAEGVAGVFEIVANESTEYSNEYGEGVILRQTPEAGKTRRIAEGELDTITVTLSRGARSGGMLDLVGQEASSARLLLERDKDLSSLNLVIQEGEPEYHDTIEEGCVVRTDPAKGTLLQEGDTVTLYLSKGPEIFNSTMVTCVGVMKDEVQRMMDELKLVAEFTEVEDSKPAGMVLSQSVDMGTSVPEGTTVYFTYSNGEKELSKTVTFSVPYSPEEVHVEIYLGTALVFEKNLPGDYGQLEETLTAKAGDYQLRIYADDQKWVDEVITFSE
ncbi:MAG: Stk1 family PASTA domain-containing Ser/Thr kinase [Oscillospiraceae bacterium]|nr:Stk1 family PASTA domain-containing Ser/Thr kinase [Oscillospiraceae bacterium]